MSYPEHLITINKHYYYRISIPVDLKHYFSVPVIQKSLKTTSIKDAKPLLLVTEYKVQKVFALLRTGMLDMEVVKLLVNDLVPRRDTKTGMGNKRVGADSKTLPEVIKRYVAAKQAEWTEKTKMEVTSVFKLLLDILGAIDVSTITKATVIELRSTLQKLPANLYKKYPNKCIKQILTLADIDPMSTKSVNKHVARLGAVLRYCIDDEGIMINNPASGLKITEKKRVDEERSAYSLGDVQKIVNALPRKHMQPERYWIPMIGLYSGMRLNEICQLHVSDVIKIDGLWCFSINDEHEKRLKNVASERVIPIHPVLVKLGLLDYVQEIRDNKAPRLWMNLTWMDVHGYSNGFGKWYQRFNRINVTDDPKKVFHSMRHTVTDTLKQIGVAEAVIAELVGHSNSGSMTMGRYGKRYQPKVLLEALMKLDYGIEPHVYIAE